MAIAETQVYMPQAPRPRLRLLEDERWLAFVLLVPTLVLLGMRPSRLHIFDAKTEAAI